MLRLNYLRLVNKGFPLVRMVQIDGRFAHAWGYRTEMVTDFFESYGSYIGPFANTISPMVSIRDKCHEAKIYFTNGE